MPRFLIVLTTFFVSLSSPCFAQFCFCHNTPNQAHKTIYVSEVFGPFMPMTDKAKALTSIRADYQAFLKEYYPDVLPNYKGAALAGAVACTNYPDIDKGFDESAAFKEDMKG